MHACMHGGLFLLTGSASPAYPPMLAPMPVGTTSTALYPYSTYTDRHNHRVSATPPPIADPCHAAYGRVGACVLSSSSLFMIFGSI